METCPHCNEEFQTSRGLDTHIGVVHDPLPESELRELYCHENLSAKEIAELKEMTHRAVKDRLTKHDLWRKDPAKFHLEGHQYSGPFTGYPRWTHTGTGHRVRVHRLQMIAKGADPHKVFDGEYSVDHINGYPLDNREKNLRLMKNSEHGAKDGERSDTGHTHKEYLRALVQSPPEWANELPVPEE
jgi:hypothetical protein